MLAPLFAAFFLLRGAPQMQIPIHDNPLLRAGFWTARLTAVKVIGKYLGLFLWPAHLSADYSYNAVPVFGWHPTEWEDAKALIALAVCLGGAALAARWYRTRKPLFFFLAWFFVALLPTSNLAILIGSIMAERFVYLPSIGLAGCLIAACYTLRGQLMRRWPMAVRRSGWIALGVLCLLGSARTYARNFDWYDELSLWTSGVSACPESAKMRLNLGFALWKLPGRLPDAVEQFEAAVRIDPDFADAHDNLGYALAKLPGRLPDAIAQFEAALRINPDFVSAHINLGNAFSQLPGRLPDAIAQFEAVVRIDPDFAPGHNMLGIALAKTPGRLPDAVAQFEAAARIDPTLADAHNNLGTALLQMPGRLPDAIAQFEATVRIHPDSAEAHNNLGIALSQMPGRLPEALDQFQTALRIDPDFEPARIRLEETRSQLRHLPSPR